MITLMATAAGLDAGLNNAGGHFPVSFTLVYIVGFIAAVSIGSIAWYNAKRPPGWEDKERPNVVPEVDDEIKQS